MVTSRLVVGSLTVLGLAAIALSASTATVSNALDRPPPVLVTQVDEILLVPTPVFDVNRHAGALLPKEDAAILAPRVARPYLAMTELDQGYRSGSDPSLRRSEAFATVTFVLRC